MAQIGYFVVFFFAFWTTDKQTINYYRKLNWKIIIIKQFNRYVYNLIKYRNKVNRTNMYRFQLM